MMGSDEVSAMVLDVGTCTTRVGFAGEDTPKCMFDTACGQIPEEKKQPLKRKLYVGRDKHRPREFMEVTSPLVDGLVEDWEALEAIYDYSFHTHLRVDPTDHPLMIAEPNFNTAAKREKTLELVFETFRSPATYFGKAAVLSAFSLGRTTALILDSGAGVTTTVPVHDGYVLNKGTLIISSLFSFTLLIHSSHSLFSFTLLIHSSHSLFSFTFFSLFSFLFFLYLFFFSSPFFPFFFFFLFSFLCSLHTSSFS